ncbi:MFS transporter [Streptacidiphilus pinicola]|uniref:MFS transporter n=1 Tax=Streptacidiphilus pinicola TaxID=2219663 RepID=UPI001402961F|nr:MFS transporter [Streptacidiphilus pinicola]
MTQLALLLLGGVLADRFGPRRIMLLGDALRCIAQAALAWSVLTGHAALWVFLGAAAVRGLGESLFNPGLGSLVVHVVPGERRGDANVLLGFAQSAARVVGPAAAGALIAVGGPGLVLAVDAATYLGSVLALALLHAEPKPGQQASLLGSLAEGWSAFASRPWLVASTVQFVCINFLVWGPFLVLGPTLAHQQPGGARAWGLIMSAYGVGALLGGLAALGRRPTRPLVVATLATVGYGAPCALFALGAPTPLLAAGATLAGVGSTVSAALTDTTTQRLTPVGVLARVRTFQTFGAFSLGPAALALAGPAAAALGARPVLACGAAVAAASAAAVLLVPSVRAVDGRDDDRP